MKLKNLSYSHIFKKAFRFLTTFLILYYLVSGRGINLYSGYIVNGFVVLLSSYGMDLLFIILNIRKSHTMDFMLQFFIFLALLLGRMYGFYSIFPWWDLFLHLLSGFLFGVLFLALLKFLVGDTVFSKLSPFFVALFVLMFSIAGAAIWEFWEFFGDQVFGFDSQLNSLLDTMSDMIIGSISGLLVSLLSYFNLKLGMFNFLNGFINGFTRIKKGP